jgi:hypothetical protein
VWMEILVLTGSPDASFRHLARGWGRDKGFHMVLAQFICERHGDVERKKRERGSRKKEEEEEYIGADVWDDACYGDVAYNEALAAELLNFSAASPSHRRISSFTLDDDEEFDEEDMAAYSSEGSPFSDNEEKQYAV